MFRKHRVKYTPLLQKASPILIFLLVLGWQWRIYDLSQSLPAYGDALEIAWGIGWFREMVLQGQQSPFFQPDIFYPGGWHLLTFANGMGLFAVLLPLSFLGNEAFAYNALVLVMLAVAFAGMYRLARMFADRFGATLAAVLYTFWGPRWTRMGGHVNVMYGSALMPWMAWGLEKAFASKGRARWWFGFVGLLWALAVSFTFYYVWLAGLLLFCWILGNLLNGRINHRQALEGTIIPGLVVATINLPLAIGFFRAKRAIAAADFSFEEVNSWGANLNSLFSPFVAHALPQMRALASRIYTSQIDESSTANFGILAVVVCLGAFVVALYRRQRAWMPLILLVLLGIVFALGSTLHWNNDVVELSVFEPVNRQIWQLGHRLKPSIFTEAEIPESVQNAVPLPGFLLTAVVPFWEGARVSARFIFPASVGFFILVALAVSRLRHWSWRIALAGLLLFELWPRPAVGVPYPPQQHPAFAWLQNQESSNAGILDLHSLQPNKLVAKVGGETLWATKYHQAPIVSGAGSIWPADFYFLMEWFFNHENPFTNPEFADLLRYYEVRYLLLHQQPPADEAFVAAAATHDEFTLVDCFEPARDARLWNYPICVIEAAPFPNQDIMLVPEMNWSAAEPWGRWAVGEQSTGRWLATKKEAVAVTLSAFPHCVPDQFQSLEISMRNELLLRHEWSDCEPWDGEFLIPADLVSVGWNEIRFNYGYALQPAAVTDNENPDARYLAVGFSLFKIGD